MAFYLHEAELRKGLRLAQTDEVSRKHVANI